LLLPESLPLWNPLSIDTVVIGCIIQHYKRGFLVQIGDQLIPESSNIVVAIENVVIVSKMVPLHLGAQRPDRPRNQSSQVLWSFSPYWIGSLDGCTEAISSPLVFFFLIDDIVFIAWIKEAVFIVRIVFVYIRLVCIHLSQSLPWALALFAKKVLR
jgi:hypothetical protein